MSEDQPPSTSSASRPGWFARLFRKFSPHPRDRAELIELLHEARKDRLFDDEEESMLEGVLDVSEMQVRDVMIPRSQMVVLERDDEPAELLEVIIESGHSRFPVIGEDRDEVVGILLAKDLLRFFAENSGGRFNIILNDVKEFIEAQAVGIERLGASRAYDPIAGIGYRSTDNSGDDTFPIFQREAFGNTFTDWD